MFICYFRCVIFSAVQTQAALFYIPRKIWKTCEGGLMASFGGSHIIFFLLQCVHVPPCRPGREAAGDPTRGLRGRGGEGRAAEGGDRQEVLGLLPEYSPSQQRLLHTGASIILDQGIVIEKVPSSRTGASVSAVANGCPYFWLIVAAWSNLVN